MRSYADKKADHFFPLSKKFFFGGSDGESAFHYYASWKWMIGAVRDVVENTTVTNPYVYGSEAGSTGEERLQHTIQRNW